MPEAAVAQRCADVIVTEFSEFLSGGPAAHILRCKHPFGLYNPATGLELLVASGVAGWLKQTYCPAATFVTGASFAGLAAALMAPRVTWHPDVRHPDTNHFSAEKEACGTPKGGHNEISISECHFGNLAAGFDIVRRGAERARRSGCWARSGRAFMFKLPCCLSRQSEHSAWRYPKLHDYRKDAEHDSGTTGGRDHLAASSYARRRADAHGVARHHWLHDVTTTVTSIGSICNYALKPAVDWRRKV